MNNKHLFIKLLILGISCSSIVNAQESSGGIPVSLWDGFYPDKFKNGISTIRLPDINNEAMQKGADDICPNCKANYYGKCIDTVINFKQKATEMFLKDKGTVWRLRIESLTAYGMQFYFSRFKLPEGATLFIFNEDVSMVLGAYTSNNNPVDKDLAIQFGTEYIQGKNIILEYYEPINVDFKAEPIIASINLLDFLPSGCILESEKYYRVKLAFTGYNNSGWYEGIQYMYTGLGTEIISDKMINDNIYGKNIIIQNSTVNTPIEINDDSILNLGLYEIDEDMDCD